MTALTGVKVLVTRPAHQADSLCQMIQEAGGEPWRLPTIEIAEIEQNVTLQACANELDHFDFAIFISVNAVQKAMPVLMNTQKQWPVSLMVITVGKKTMDYLTEHWQLPVVCGAQPYNTEALLNAPALQTEQVSGKRIVIFRGEGGRELLAEALRQRGADIVYINVYRRVQPLIPEWIQQQQPDLAIVTSREGLQNLYNMLEGQPWLRQMPLVVMSERVLAEARVLGVQAQTFVANKACDEGLFDAVLKWRQFKIQSETIQ